MSVDFETRLRTDFAAVPVDIPWDAEATLAAGRRARGRRIGAVIGGLAVVAAVAVFSLPMLLRTSIPAIPEPIGVSSTARFEELGNPSPQRVRHATIEVGRSAGELRIAVEATLESGSLSQEFTHPDDGSTWLEPLSDQVWAAVVPDPVEWVSPVTREGGGWSWDEQPLPDLGMTAVLMVAEHRGAIDGLIWKRADGTAWNSLGDEVSLLSNADGEGADVYADAALDVMGMRTGGGGMEKRLSEVGPDRLVQSMVEGDRAGVRVFRGLFLLPEGDYPEAGPEPDFVFQQDVDHVRSISGVLVGGALDGRYVVAVRYSAPATVTLEGTSLIESLTYTAANGRRVTVIPGVGEVPR